MQFGQLHHIEYYVKDLKRSMEFWGWFLSEMGYSDSHGWEGGMNYIHPNGTYIVFVQLAPEAMKIENNRQGNGLNHIAFMGKSKAHLDHLERGLRERNIKILGRRDDYLWFEDHDDLAAEVYAPANET
jgi:catechol 2,3-dioxygenase-like lactoylglutathione lyase family enzyme